MDLVSNQKLLWKKGFLRDDGRMFDSSLLDQTDEAKLVKEVKEARMALIEQVHFCFLLKKTPPPHPPETSPTAFFRAFTGC